MPKIQGNEGGEQAFPDRGNSTVQTITELEKFFTN